MMHFLIGLGIVAWLVFLLILASWLVTYLSGVEQLLT